MNCSDKVDSELEYLEKAPSIDNIWENIYIGNYSAALNRDLLKELGITHILICGKNLKAFFPEDFVYEYLSLYDSEYTKINKFFAQSNQFIDDGNNKGKVLVHCGSGISRSVSMVSAYLIFKGIPFSDGIKLLKTKRRIANPNNGFEKQLRNYSYEVLNKF